MTKKTLIQRSIEDLVSVRGFKVYRVKSYDPEADLKISLARSDLYDGNINQKEYNKFKRKIIFDLPVSFYPTGVFIEYEPLNPY